MIRERKKMLSKREKIKGNRIGEMLNPLPLKQIGNHNTIHYNKFTKILLLLIIIYFLAPKALVSWALAEGGPEYLLAYLDHNIHVKHISLNNINLNQHHVTK